MIEARTGKPKPTNEMVRRFHLLLAEDVSISFSSEEDYRHADSSVGIDLGKNELSPHSAGSHQ